MIFDHEVQDVNLIITALEHKIRDLQVLLQKMIKSAQEQMPVQKVQAEPVDDANHTS
jgi:hypothetical protein